MSEERIYSDVTEENVTESFVEAEMKQEQVVAKKGFATAALVLGILAMVTTLFFLNYIFGLLALIFGIIYLVKKADVKPKGKAITGVVLASLSLIISTTLWVSIFVYFTKSSITDIIEDFGSLTGQEVDGREVINQAITDAVGGEIMLGDKPLNLDTIEEFVGGEVSLDRIIEFKGDVTTEDINEFVNELQNMDQEKVSGLLSEFEGEVTYESLEEKLGENFTLEEIMDFVKDYQAPTQE